MRRTILLLAALTSTSLAMGCDPVFSLEGSIKSPSGPVVGADVALSCPEAVPVQSTSDAAGRVDYRRMGTAHPDCRVIVSKAGFRRREIPLASICRSHFGLACSRAELDIELAPAP